ncbi:MAG: hypothetical protein QG675_350 [Patescibacteria group bacterium]|jgi:hypothetical protein|nr:hypothetical protein [Patescibacteria group bacterium]
MEFEGTEADEAEEFFGDQKQKKTGSVVVLVFYIAIAIFTLLLVGRLLTSTVEPVEYEPTTSDEVADILSDAFYNSTPNQVIIPLHEDFNGTYGGENDCKIDITFNRATTESVQFVTAVTHGRRCRVGYSVDTLGYYENYSFPDTRVTYVPETGFPIRHIAFTACRPSRQPMPDCFTVKVSRSDLLGESG